MEENGSIVVLSLFDGMSCGQTALKELGIIPETYYASEIDKYAIAQTQLNFPNTIQLGSVTTVDVANLKHIDLLIGGSPCQSFSFAGKRKGMSTKSDVEIYTLEKYLELKEQGFEFEGQSYLFWEYMRILTDIRKYNPNVKFLLENVEMGNKWERVLSEAIGIYGVHINSALVSAQNRKRIYWTNIRTKQVGLFGELHTDIPQPKDEGILLRDVLERDVPEKYYLSSKMMNWLDKHDKKSKENGNGFKLNLKNGDDKGGCISSGAFKQSLSADYVCVAMRGRNPDNPSDRTTGAPTEQRLEPNLSGKTNCLTSVQKDNLVVCLTPKRTDYGKQIRKQYEAGEVSVMRKEVSQLEPREDGKTNTITTVQKDNLVIQLNPSKESGGVQPYQQNRVYDPNGISSCLNTDSRPHAIVEINERQKDNLVLLGNLTGGKWDKTHDQNTRVYSANGKMQTLQTMGGGNQHPKTIQHSRIRRLTPTEVARLQTVPDWYVWACSDSQIYRMCGNGWTIKVISWIFSFL